MTQEPTRSTLDYGRRPTRRLLWRAAVVLVVLAIAVAALRWGPIWKRQATMLLDQHRCMTYRAPADQVVYETPVGEDGLRQKATTCFAPPCWTRFKGGATPAAAVFLHGLAAPRGTGGWCASKRGQC